jgi:hypothetical protein
MDRVVDIAPVIFAPDHAEHPPLRPHDRQHAAVSIAASAHAVVFVILPWGNASFLMAIVTLFGWIAALAARPRDPSLIKTCVRDDRAG